MEEQHGILYSSHNHNWSCTFKFVLSSRRGSVTCFYSMNIFSLSARHQSVWTEATKQIWIDFFFPLFTALHNISFAFWVYFRYHTFGKYTLKTNGTDKSSVCIVNIACPLEFAFLNFSNMDLEVKIGDFWQLS